MLKKQKIIIEFHNLEDILLEIEKKFGKEAKIGYEDLMIYYSQGLEFYDHAFDEYSEVDMWIKDNTENNGENITYYICRG